MNYWLSSKIYNDKNLEDIDVCTYVLMKCMYRIYPTDHRYLNISDLIAFGYDQLHTDGYTRKKFCKSVERLIEKNIIVGEKIRSDGFYIDVSCFRENLKKEKIRQIQINPYDIKKILQSSYKNRISLVRYYLVLLGTFDYTKDSWYKSYSKTKSGIIGNTTCKNLAELLDTSESIICKYNKQLVELKSIYIRKCGTSLIGCNDWVSLPNVYSRYEDRACAIKHANYIEGTNDDVRYYKQISANYKRKMTQMYNNLVKGKKYTLEQIYEMYDAIKQMNEELQKKYDLYLAQEYLDRQKDLSIFKQYGIDI